MEDSARKAAEETNFLPPLPSHQLRAIQAAVDSVGKAKGDGISKYNPPANQTIKDISQVLV